MTCSPPGAVAVVGLGLIGGSLCRALRQALPAIRLVGIDVDADAIDRASASGVCDAVGSAPELLGGADLVVLCAPLETIPGWARLCAEHAPAAPVTDCGSTKVWIVDAVRSIPGVRFLGGHPMAGREQGGWDRSEPGLFAGSTWVLTPEPGTDMAVFDPWLAALSAIGAHVEIMTPGDHDRAVAWSSHLPLAVSSALVNAVAASAEWPFAGRLTGGGFRDAARLAGGDPRLHAAIATTNSAALGEALDGLCAQLAALRLILDDQSALLEYFERGRQTRREWLEARDRSRRPVR